MLELIGWIGGLCLAICAVPQAIHAYKVKHCNGITSWCLMLWLVGEILTAVYVFPKQDYPLLFNYSINIVCLVIICRYKYFPKE